VAVPLVETAGRNTDPDAHREEPLGCGDYLLRVARHF
jgi:hypothetical protein